MLRRSLISGVAIAFVFCLSVDRGLCEEDRQVYAKCWSPPAPREWPQSLEAQYVASAPLPQSSPTNSNRNGAPDAAPSAGGQDQSDIDLELINALASVLSEPAGTIVVDCNGNWDYSTIQEAIDAAVDGDSVIVLPSLPCAEEAYVENIVFPAKAITLQSLNPQDPAIVAATIIDGASQNAVIKFAAGATPQSVLDGLTLRNGRATEDVFTGGVYCGNSSPTIRGCRITDCTGSGLVCEYSANAHISNCWITGNTADGGGGICCAMGSSPTIENCIIAGNEAEAIGGGIFCYEANPTFVDCVVSGNMSEIVCGGCGGGGVHCWNSSPTFVRCTINGNQTDQSRGGGFLCLDSGVAVISSLICGNVGAVQGGGIDIIGGSNSAITSCAIIGNSTPYSSGGGIICQDAATKIVNCTIVHNCAAQHGGAIRCWESNPVLKNCLLWYNSPDEVSLDGQSTVEITYGDVCGGWLGVGNTNVNPGLISGHFGVWSASGAFDPSAYQVTLTDAAAAWPESSLVGKCINPDISQPLHFAIVENTQTTVTVWADWSTVNARSSWIEGGAAYQVRDFHLAATSPCLEAGNPAHVPDAGETDIDGETRLLGCVVDIGADEVITGVANSGDIDGSGLLGLEDIQIFVAALLNGNDHCVADTNQDGRADGQDIPLFLASIIAERG
jgi:hypothetical protein